MPVALRVWRGSRCLPAGKSRTRNPASLALASYDLDPPHKPETRRAAHMDVRRFSIRAWMPCRKIPSPMNRLVCLVRGRPFLLVTFLDSRPWRSPLRGRLRRSRAWRAVCQQRKVTRPQGGSSCLVLRFTPSGTSSTTHLAPSHAARRPQAINKSSYPQLVPSRAHRPGD